MILQRGFTLIELIVVITIIAILTSIALPSYTDYVMRSRIPEATSALSTARVRLEQHFNDNRNYVGFPCARTVGNFNITCVEGGATVPTTTAASTITYTLQATGFGQMAGFTYTINETDNRTSTIVAPAPAGWRAAPGCWITRAGGQC